MIPTTRSSNQTLTDQLMLRLHQLGVKEYILCPSTRNSPIVEAVLADGSVPYYTWPEERSAAFFAVGRARALKAPVAIVVTSGTAVGELLPACMEAFYASVPLLLITADRPRRFEGIGAPQSAEQIGIFSHYAKTAWDVCGEQDVPPLEWDGSGPAHLNVRYEDPHKGKAPETESSLPCATAEEFLEACSFPLVVVGALEENECEAVVDFLVRLGAPVYLEGHSGLREDKRLQDVQICSADGIWKKAETNGYPIDGILRIGGIPTIRIWRDLDDDRNTLPVFSISRHPFKGNPHSGLLQGSIFQLIGKIVIPEKRYAFEEWQKHDILHQAKLQALFQEFPTAEASLVHALSEVIPAGSLVYLGNSLPIREWDLAASKADRRIAVWSSRGVNGIDGQISTFLGLAQPDKENWAIIGDLTLLYDLVGPWILDQLKNIKANIVVINNGGGRIFARMFARPEFQNLHHTGFKGLAEMWGMPYERWESIPEKLSEGHGKLIEIIPDETASQAFWNTLNKC